MNPIHPLSHRRSGRISAHKSTASVSIFWRISSLRVVRSAIGIMFIQSIDGGTRSCDICSSISGDASELCRNVNMCTTQPSQAAPCALITTS